VTRLRAALRWISPWLLWLALSAGPAWAECPPAAQPLDEARVRQLMAQASDHGFLWRVEKDGRASWLFGTLHVGKPDWMFPGPMVAAAMRGADRVGLELDVLDPDVMQQLREATQTAGDGGQALPPALATRLAAQARQACVGTALDGLKPEMRVMTLLALAGRARGLDPAYGVDAFLAGFGRGLGKRVMSLETPQEQLAAMQVDEASGLAQRLSDALDELEQPDTLDQLERLANDWAGSRLDDLTTYGQWCHCLETPSQQALYERTVLRRNRVLARRIAAVHEAGQSLFAAVGALHMIGPQGLPALLAADGFDVHQLLPAPGH
jgi:uncharacterized protein